VIDSCLGDLLVAQAAGHHPHDLDLARGQDGRRFRGTGLAAQQSVERAAADGLIDPLPSRRNTADAVEDLQRRTLLQHDAGHAEFQRLENLLVLDPRRQQDHAHGRTRRVELAQHVHPAAARHDEVGDGDVGTLARDCLERLVAVRAARHHGDVRLQRQELVKPAQDDRVVVGEQYPDRRNVGHGDHHALRWSELKIEN
jgi:hypothetical protein